MARFRMTMLCKALFAAALMVVALSVTHGEDPPPGDGSVEGNDVKSWEEIEWPPHLEWPSGETWLVLVPGSKLEDSEDECPDAVGTVATIGEEFCTKHDLSPSMCDGAVKELAKVSSQHPQGAQAFTRLEIKYPLTVRIDLTMENLEDAEVPQKTVAFNVSLAENIKVAVMRFCVEEGVGDGDCAKLTERTAPHWVQRRAHVLRMLEERFDAALAHITKVEKHTGNWSDVVLGWNHLEEMSKVDSKDWRIFYLMGSLLTQASNRQDVALQLTVQDQNENSTIRKDGAVFFQKALESYRRSLAMHNEAYPVDGSMDVSGPAVATRLQLETTVAEALFHANQVEDAKELWNNTLNIAQGLRSVDETGVERIVFRDSFKKAALALIALLFNTESYNDAEAVINRLVGVSEFEQRTNNPPPLMVSESEKLSLRLMSATVFPLAYTHPVEAAAAWKRAVIQLEQVRAGLVANPQTAVAWGAKLFPYIGFYGIYAGAPSGVASERDFRNKLAAVHRLASPSVLQFYSPLLKELEEESGDDKRQDEGRSLKRVGFVSRHFYDHSVGKLLCETVRSVAKELQEGDEGSEVAVYAVQVGRKELVSSKPGACAGLLQSKKNFLLLDIDARMSLPNATKKAYDLLSLLQMDVLVFADGSLDPVSYFLTFGRMAPVQIAFWSHPLTLGGSGNTKKGSGPQIDFFVTSSKFYPDPSAAGQVANSAERLGAPLCSSDTHELGGNSFVPFSESLLCTESLGTVFKRPTQPSKRHLARAREIIEESFAREEDLKGVTMEDARIYYLPHKAMKLHPAMDTFLVKILMSDPKAVLVFIEDDGSSNAVSRSDVSNTFSVFESAKKKITQRLKAQLPGARISWLKPMPKSVFLAVGQLAAATLESFGSFGSGVTALELLGVGVPMVSFPGKLRVMPSVHGMYNLLAERLQEPFFNHDLSCIDTDNVYEQEVDENGEQSNVKDEINCYAAKSLRLATDLELKTKWTEALLDARAVETLFEDKLAAKEWATIFKGLHFNATRSYKYVGKERSEEANDAVLAQFLRGKPNPEIAFADDDEDDNDEFKFRPHTIQIKDNLILV